MIVERTRLSSSHVERSDHFVALNFINTYRWNGLMEFFQQFNQHATGSYNLSFRQSLKIPSQQTCLNGGRLICLFHSFISASALFYIFYFSVFLVFFRCTLFRISIFFFSVVTSDPAVSLLLTWFKSAMLCSLL